MNSILQNLKQARFDAQEASGALGDLGTFLPLVLGMAQQNGLDFGAALFFAGLLNLITGLLFPVPMAVQPMKAIAAVAVVCGTPRCARSSTPTTSAKSLEPPATFQ